MISSRNQDACDEVAAAISARGHKAMGIACNINHKDQLHQLVDKTKAALGKIDVLVNNAALNPFFGKSQDIPDEAFDKIMHANIGSVHRLCQLVIPGIAESGGGAVVIISSIGGLKGNRGAEGGQIGLLLDRINGREGNYTKEIKTKALNTLINYYAYHISRMEKLDTLEIVKEVLN